MSTADAMARVLSSLDWVGDPAAGTLAIEEADQLRSYLGDGAARWVAGAVEQSVVALQGQIHDWLAPWSIIRTFAQEVLTATLLGLAGVDLLQPDAATINHDLAEDIVGRDIPLSDITRALRRMQQEWLSLLIDAARDLRPDAVSVVPALATSVTGSMDAWIAAATDAIVEERRRVDLAEQVRIRSTIGSLVDASPVDIDAASQLLRIPLSGWHLGCAIGAPTAGAVERRIVDGFVHSLARSIGGARTLRYETSTGMVHVWVSTEGPPQVPRWDDLPLPSPLVVGIGEPHHGASGFRRTFVEASDVLRLAVRLGRSGGLSYDDAALVIVLSQDEERASWFVEHELRDLAADTAEMADMRHTLRTFFGTRMRIAPAA
ncbi:MAG: hypothetical protein ABWZ16_06990, partial [Microbacterium sp.]